MLPIFVQDILGASRYMRFSGGAGENAAHFSRKKFAVQFSF